MSELAAVKESNGDVPSIAATVPDVPIESPSKAVAAPETEPPSQPVDAQPVDAQPIDAQPVDVQPADAQPVHVQPIDAQLVDADSEAKPAAEDIVAAVPEAQKAADDGMGDVVDQFDKAVTLGSQNDGSLQQIQAVQSHLSAGIMFSDPRLKM